MPIELAGTDGTCPWTGLRGHAACYGGRRRGAGSSALLSRHRRSTIGGIVVPVAPNCHFSMVTIAPRGCPPQRRWGETPARSHLPAPGARLCGSQWRHPPSAPCPASRGRKVAAAAAAAVAPAHDATGGAWLCGHQRIHESQPPLQWVGSLLSGEKAGRRPQPPALSRISSYTTGGPPMRHGVGNGGVVQFQKGWRRQPSPLYSSQTDPTAGARPTSDSPRQPRRRRLPADSPARRRPLRWGGGRHHRWRR